MMDIDRTIEEARAEMLPYESWEQIKGETAPAFSAFCSYRDFGTDRNIRKAIISIEKDIGIREKKYRVWRNWATQFRWRERASDYDKYIEKLKQEEIRKNIEAQGEKHRQVTGKMLDVVNKKLDLMNPEELTQGMVAEWTQTAIKAERENMGLVATNDKTEAKQSEFNFVSDFHGL
jgi:hypothetical protein